MTSPSAITARSDSLRPRPDAPALRVVARAGVAVALFALALCGCAYGTNTKRMEILSGDNDAFILTCEPYARVVVVEVSARQSVIACRKANP
jgi:hypothetical protein